jgi:hypothetical protein
MKNIKSFKLFETLDKNKKQVIIEVINKLKSFKQFPIVTDDLEELSKKLKNIGIKPVDIDAAIYDPKKQKQYLITGPSAPGGGGSGALKDLMKMLNG